jgi:hypothetical protein
MDQHDLTSWRDGYRALQSERSETCPDDERLAGLAIGELEGSARDELADHVVACRPCSGSYRDLAQLHEAASGTQKRVRSRAWWAVAAMTLVALTTLVSVRQLDTGPGSTEDFRGNTAIGAPIEPVDRAALTAPPAIVSWQLIADAESYQLLLFDREGGAIWQSEPGDSSSVMLPEAVREQITPPGPYLWRVRYVAGLERLETDLRRFTIEP